MAGQFTFTKGPVRHGERLWTKRANTSFPDQLSPRMRMDTFKPAARSTRCRTACIAADGPKYIFSAAASVGLGLGILA